MQEGEKGRRGEGETTAFAVVEMMGHRKVVGIISESKYGPGNLIRVDVFGKDGNVERTEHVGVGSIYCLTEVTEAVAKAAAAAHSPKPSWAYGIETRAEHLLPNGYMDTDDNDETDGEREHREYLRDLQGLPDD